jgi:hypothetical protein
MQTQEVEEVLRFWFPDLSNGDHTQLVRQFEWWFRGGADAAITERFANLLERAIRGDLDHWARQARSRLALIIVLDQFSRSLYRDTARAFAQDPKALALALEGIEIGHYAVLATASRYFHEGQRDCGFSHLSPRFLAVFVLPRHFVYFVQSLLPFRSFPRPRCNLIVARTGYRRLT